MKRTLLWAAVPVALQGMALAAFAALLFLAASCAAPRSQLKKPVSAAPASPRADESPLFLHLLAPHAYGDRPSAAHRLVTARVYPGQDFSISLADARDPFATPWAGAFTNPIWTNGVPQARPLQNLWNSADATLAGRIERVDGKFIAHLQGWRLTTLNYYHGQIELEKPVFEQGGYYHHDAVWGVWFALSTNSDCSGFIQALEDGRLTRPNVVDKDSPLVDRWLHDKSSAPPATPHTPAPPP